ncbi:MULTISPECIES: NnrS family protein [Modicisalibacter]|uniref:NnrS family protein n=1 Tax=Modicisalibacter TaxID=574347 RepID=UPI00100AF241|nr:MULTISPECIES: NnrS family protein [Halomonadaceae]MBZ9558796.1 NnrS family protein [Modicisalibacter sp. R2A 31.J]MBZ9575313.1 NnrS family protein [Modicisalibacter sp. MOD 31.J]
MSLSRQLTHRAPLWRLAFRPFFLLAATFALLAMLVWGGVWNGYVVLAPYGGLMWWHPHEMLFGFAAAVVVGFLLTAVRNWTGQPGIAGLPLLGLAALWLAARLLIAFPQGMPAVGVAVVDIAFLPLAAVLLARPVIRCRQWRNLIFVPVLALLAVANLATHLALYGAAPELLGGGEHLAVLLITLLMVILGGRVIPFFTARRLGLSQASRPVVLEALAIGGAAALVGLQLAALLGGEVPAGIGGVVAGVAALANLVRWLRWAGWHGWRDPLLWSLHLSYGFVCLGLSMWALAAWHIVSLSLAVHALTVGGMASMMLAMMARVALGHTGRPIVAPRGIGTALALMLLAGVARALLPALWPQSLPVALDLAVFAWCLAFALYLARYAPVLVRARADGGDG